MELFHGSNEIISAIKNTGIFGGLFASSNKDAALSHGAKLHVINAARVLSQHDLNYEIDYELIANTLRSLLSDDLSDEELDTAYAAVIDEKDVYRMDEDDILRIFRADDLGEAGWEAQRIRGQVAKKLGYDAVEMSDEHGTSYLVLPGTKIEALS